MFWRFGKSKHKRLLNLSLPVSKRGFSLIELIVVISIFLIVTAVVFVDIPNFREKSSLDLITSEVATYIRGAQVYGAAQRSGEAGGPIVYGLSFSTNSQSFSLFKDDKLSIQENYELHGFNITGLKIIGADNNPSPQSNLDIVFQASDYVGGLGTRLEPEVFSNYSSDASPLGFNFVEIKISSLRSGALERCVLVYNNGQIAPAPCRE